MITFNENETATKSLVEGPAGRRAGMVVALRETKEGREFVLGAEARRWVLGSGESCDIVVSDPYVSSVHAVLERRPGGALVVRDRPSRNGTMIDGNMIEAAELSVGSYLSIGRTTLIAVAATSTGHAQPSALEALRGKDPALRSTIDQALKTAQSDCSVMIVGETGTGKDLLARVIHEAGRRAQGKLVAVNCGGIPKELIGSELFGHEKGAFTGAMQDRDGIFVEASGGTLFLDEIGELPIDMQPNLLRVLETRQVRRVGGTADRNVDVRIISATNRMEGLGTEASKLRLDLYHRLATVVLHLPPLRHRAGDIVELVESMLKERAPTHGPRAVSAEGWKALAAYPWPGNVRELRHAVARAVTLGGSELMPADFFPDMRTGQALFELTPDVLNLGRYEETIKGMMADALARFGSIRAAAEHLGIAKSTFADRAKAFGLVTPRTRPPRPPPKPTEK